MRRLMGHALFVLSVPLLILMTIAGFMASMGVLTWYGAEMYFSRDPEVRRRAGTEVSKLLSLE